MGKTKRWLKSLLGGGKKSSSPSTASAVPNSNPSKQKNNWASPSPASGVPNSNPTKPKNNKAAADVPFNPTKTNDNNTSGGGSSSSMLLNPTSYSSSSLGPYVNALDDNKHAIAVAEATAAVADAALAAAKAAAEVVRLTSGGTRTCCASQAYVSVGGLFDTRLDFAAVKIQSAFRAYLARTALRALKGLVKLQALVRGHIVRKQSADMLRRMQAMARIQAQACANRAYVLESPHSSSKSYQYHQHRFGSKSSIKDNVGLLSPNLLGRWMEQSSWNSNRNMTNKNRHTDDEKSDKILEIDTWKPHLNFKQGDGAFHSSHNVPAWLCSEPAEFSTIDCLARQSKKSHKPNPSLSYGEAPSLRSVKFPLESAQPAVWTAENSPKVNSSSSRPSSSGRGHFSPAKSECPRSLFGDYLRHPNYMANTESYLAKLRSQSVPRQRIQFEKSGSTKRFVRGFCDAETSSKSGSTLHANFRSQGYPSRLNRLGTTTQGDFAGYSSTHGSRC